MPPSSRCNRGTEGRIDTAPTTLQGPCLDRGLSRDADVAEEDRRPTGGAGLLLVAGFGPVGRPRRPIAGSLLRPRKRPARRDTLKRPLHIVHIVGRPSELRAVLQDAGEAGEGPGIDQAALAVALLGPGVGKQYEQPADGGVRQTIEQEPARRRGRRGPARSCRRLQDGAEGPQRPGRRARSR